jgi:hypothetical protein
MHAVLELLNQILLIAAVVGREDDWSAVRLRSLLM